LRLTNSSFFWHWLFEQIAVQMVQKEMAAPASILHVDDDPDIRLIVDMSLSLDRGLRVSSASSATDAIAALERPGAARPDLVILDYRIGAADGLDLLGRIRAIPGAARIPVIFLTARAMPKDLSAMIAAGAAGVLTKPFNPLTLAREVRRLMGGRAAP
jgi:two-component system, OmpR family, response regulator